MMDLTGIDRWWERRVRTDPLVRLMRHVSKDAATGCWNWTGTRTYAGYGQFRLDPETSMGPAHRAAYTLIIGPVDDDLQLDHLCRNRACVNPGHLEPVTPQTNTDRSLNAKRDVCDLAGHPMTDDNTGARKDGKRYCKTCHRDCERRRRANRAA